MIEAISDTIRAVAEFTGTSMSTVGIVLLVIIPLMLIAMAVTISSLIYCKKHKKACFADKGDASKVAPSQGQDVEL